MAMAANHWAVGAIVLLRVDGVETTGEVVAVDTDPDPSEVEVRVDGEIVERDATEVETEAWP